MYLWVISYNPQESLENTTNTMCTRTLGMTLIPGQLRHILHRLKQR